MRKKKNSGHSVGKLRVIYEQFEDTNGVIRTRKSNKGRRYNGKGQTLIYKTLHGKLRIEQHETHKNQVKPAPHVTTVVLLLLQTR